MILLYLVSLLAISVPSLGDQKINNRKFPADFMFGVASSAYQVEGAWNEDGKGPNIWDTMIHEKPDLIVNKDNGDVACDSYHKYKEDVKMLKYLGVTHYRFSLSWSRILPTGYSNKINSAGVKYYRNLIKELRDNKIEPLVTIFHWDLPQPIQDAGGWPNPNIIQWYTDYAKVCFELFGDLVKYWITFNEPINVCHMGYGRGENAPRIKSAEAEFLCSHNLILSHARVYHLYNDTFRKTQKGKMGIVIDAEYFEPASNKTEDITAAENELLFSFGWYAHPIVTGNYPAVMIEHMARHSKLAGFKNSILPLFSDKMSKYVKGTIDYLGVNMYTSFIAKATTNYTTDSVFWQDSIEAHVYQLPSWKKSAVYWLRLTPWGMGKLVKWITKTYGKIPIIITENGIPDDGTTLQDDLRIEQIQTYLSSLKDTMDSGEVNVFGYTHWSMMDSFEWGSGYSVHFGLYSVDFKHPNRTRTPKRSVEYYRKVINTRCLVDKCQE